MRFQLRRLHAESESGRSKNIKDSPSNDPPSYSVSTSSLSSINSRSFTDLAPLSSTDSSRLTPLRSGTDSRRPNTAPYRPSREQQKQIDLLTKSNPQLPLSATTSSAHTDYFDVLPSFQMFQSILKRDDNQFEENLSINPPEYGDTMNSSPTPPSALSPVSSQRNHYNLDTVVDQVTNRLNEFQLQREQGQEEEEAEGFLIEDNDSDNDNASNFVRSHELYGHTVLDNIDRLPRLRSSPLDIQIYVTKGVPRPHMACEMETRLKEYTSGDAVNGYIIITNNSDEPVDFGLFMVSLEGTIKITERKLGTHDAAKPYSRILIKKFLKMYDLSASYGYTDVPNSAGIEYEAFTIDEYDGCQIGLPDERVLEPRKKYKKFFTFKFPDRLLDYSCADDVLLHILPPPSMGIDKQAFYNGAKSLQIDKSLGYATLNVRGTPILTKDYSFDDVSINYTIDAKFIDKLHTENQKTPLSESDINDPNSDSEYAISRSRQYFVRFIPDLEKQLAFYDKVLSYNGFDSYGTLGIDGSLFQKYNTMSTWASINELKAQIEKEIDSTLIHKDLSSEEIKNRNLVISIPSEENRGTKTDPKEERLKLSLKVSYDSFYASERMIGNKIPVDIYAKKNVLSPSIKIGDMKLFVKVPTNPLPYTSPSLIQKFNNGSISSSSTPAGGGSFSNINELYNKNDKDLITSVEISLHFLSSDFSVRPHDISSIAINVVLWSYQTTFPLPLELDYDFFYAKHDTAERLNDNVSITRDNLQSLKETANKYITYLKANKIHISKRSYHYLKSMKSLGIKKDTVKDYFKAIYPSDLASLKSAWSGSQSSEGVLWKKKLTLPLTTINRSNNTIAPSFQTCLVGRLYCLEVSVKFKGSGTDQRENYNTVTVDVPILAG
ncbi:uncharacterized protein PRCAT00001282001 [Priceomyces carsonii]|uniref:uncharacterized protein n=1 Tax=Priceomyces carsonii TaxID=28549 RepID=UPI002ED779E7|nr:unnamed protein product [Priceomyces carsonii]